MSWIEKFKEKKEQRKEEKRKRREGEQTFDELVYDIKKVMDEPPPGAESLEPNSEPDVVLEPKKKKKKKDE